MKSENENADELPKRRKADDATRLEHEATSTDGASGDSESELSLESIDRYEIRGQIGSGGFGTVFRGYDPRLNRDVAIKLPKRKIEACDPGNDRFLMEAKAAASLNHPNIVQLYDAIRDGHRYFVVMEYVEGKSLADELRERRQIPLQRALHILKQVVVALDYLEKKKMVHRDIKPGNILLAAEDQVKITDFGLALTEDSPAWYLAERAGTKRYMAPEQVLGENHRLDGRTDLWAVGVILYELVSGHSPFAGSDAKQIYHQILTGEARRLSQRQPNLPPFLESICMRCLAKCMNDRYAHASELLLDLERLELELGESEYLMPAGDIRGADASRTISDFQSNSFTRRGEVKLIPKGLRSFDAADALFYRKLLPGPRDTNDCAPSLQFWLKWASGVEDETTWQRVGLIYGPSGCGKSSFVKAGLIPKLPSHIVACYFDFTSANPLETLRQRLRRQFPECQDADDLVTQFALIRRGAEKRKVILIFDQFEQYLVRHEIALDHELLQALRQCDGKHLSSLLLVRDEFWSQASRCMRMIESPLSDEKNALNLPLFEPAHASRVLEGFGRAYGQLPPSPTPLSDEEKSFVDTAVQGLAVDGRVVCVKLAIFSELMQSHPWTLESLKKLGGMDGVGVRFLLDAFQSTNATPRRRDLLLPCQKLLSVLLPEESVDWKASSLEKKAWIQRSGILDSMVAEDAIDLLVNDLRWVSVANASSSNSWNAEDEDPLKSNVVAEPAYSLTHDYLVRPIRAWIADSDRSSWKGRARQKLRELSLSYHRTGSARQLPSTLEWISILAAVGRRERTDDENKLIAAAKPRALRQISLVLACLLMLFSFAGLAIQRNMAAQQSLTQRIDSLLMAFLDADPSRLASILRELELHADLATEQLALRSLDPSKASGRSLLLDYAIEGKLDCEFALNAMHDGSVEELKIWQDYLSRRQHVDDMVHHAMKAGRYQDRFPLILTQVNLKEVDSVRKLLTQDFTSSDRLEFLAFAVDRIAYIENQTSIEALSRLIQNVRDTGCSYVAGTLLGEINQKAIDSLRDQVNDSLTNLLNDEEYPAAMAGAYALAKIQGSSVIPSIPIGQHKNWMAIEPVPGARIVMGAVDDDIPHRRWVAHTEIPNKVAVAFDSTLVGPDSRDENLPLGGITTLRALELCNWLSDQANLRRSIQIVFTEDEANENPAHATDARWIQIEKCKKDGKWLNVYFDPEADGFRLPFRSEILWCTQVEYDCFEKLEKKSFLFKLAHMQKNITDQIPPRATGFGFPNPMGFADILGNMREPLIDDDRLKALQLDSDYTSSINDRQGMFAMSSHEKRLSEKNEYYGLRLALGPPPRKHQTTKP